MLPLEKEYVFHEFHSPKLEDADFDGKPLAMLVGQYSTGKTTFIKYLALKNIQIFKINIRYILEQEYPGMRIGPEPTTDTFHIVDYGQIFYPKFYLYALFSKVNLARSLAMFLPWIPRNHLHN